MLLDTPTSDRQVVMVRYLTAMVAPFLDRATVAGRVAAGWSLIESEPAARAALTMWLADTLELLDSTRSCVARDAASVLRTESGLADAVRYAHADSRPNVTPEARRVLDALHRATQQELRVVVHKVNAPGGQPPRLNGLRMVVERWVRWTAGHGCVHDRGRYCGERAQPSVAATMLIDGFWHSSWRFEPADLELAIRSMWAQISANDADYDPLVEAAERARSAWAIASASESVAAEAPSRRPLLLHGW